MSKFVFLFVFCGALLLEGTGIRYGREIALFALIALPYLLLFIDRKKPILIHKNLKTLFVGFILFSALSTIFSQNLENSIPFLLFYISSIMLFIYVYNNKKAIEPYIIPVILGFSAFFIFYSVVLTSFLAKVSFLRPETGYQMVFSRFGSHNHLGDFLLLPLIYLFYNILNSKPKRKLTSFLSIFLLLPYFVFSFSRSAYLALVFVVIIMFLEVVRKKIFKFSLPTVSTVIFSVIMLLTLTFSLVYSQEGSLSNKIFLYFTHNYGLEGKSADGNRLDYMNQGLAGIKQMPLIGLGPGNFMYTPKNLDYPYTPKTDTAHNIFLDVFVENGIPAGIIFVLIISMIIIKSRRNVYFFMALALLLNFQTDYTYRIASIFILFFILMGLVLEEDIKHKGRSLSDRILAVIYKTKS